MGGLEPTNSGFKARCLTTWLHPKKKKYAKKIFVYRKVYKLELGGIRTPDTVVRSHAL